MRIGTINETHDNELRTYDNQSRNLAEKLVKLQRRHLDQENELKIIQATLKVV